MGLAELMAEGQGETAVLGADSEGTAAGVNAPESVAKPEELGVEADEKGAPKTVPWTAVAEQRAKRRAAEERAEKAEKALQELEGKHAARSKTLDELYGKFEKPEDQLREDATVAEAMWALKDKPEIQAALRLIQQHSQGAKVSDRTEKPAAAAEPQPDPMVAELVRERTRDTVDAILRDAKVRPELHGVISEYVLEMKGLKPTREAVLSTIKEYVNAQGWTQQFLRAGAADKPRPAALPNPGGFNGGTAKPKEGDAAKTDKPKNLTGIQQENRNKFREMWNAKFS